MDEIKCPKCGDTRVDLWDSYSNDLDTKHGYYYRSVDWFCLNCGKRFTTEEEYEVKLKKIEYVD